MPITRRGFLNSLGATVTVPTLIPGLGLSSAAAQTGQVGDILVCIFQRGGADGLNIVVPFGDDDYYALRSNLAIPAPGQGAGSALDLDGFFGFHPNMAGLKPLYDAGQLAVVHATGSPHETRSHFDAMDFMERAYLQKSAVFDGWLGRHLDTLAAGNTSPFRAVGMGAATQTALRGEELAIAISGIENFSLAARPEELAAIKTTLTELYDGTDPLALQAQQALAATEMLQQADPLQYQPDNGAVYPGSGFGQTLLQVGQLIKAQELGMEVICVDIGGWDTHNQQNVELANLLQDFSDSLAAFYTDMGSRMAYITVVTMSEFGRRAYENASGGTDHGHGNCMLALGGGVNGGVVYTDWPGLAQSQLYAGGDLEVSTDWRTVLGELVNRRLNNTALDQVFPDYPMPAFLDIFKTLGA